MRNRLIILGIDGGTWRLIEPLKENGHLPTLKEFVDRGTHGILISTIPPNTIPAWTSVFTGTNPGKHGLTSFIIRKNHTNLSVATARDRMVDSIWRILSRHGLRSIVINDPVTYPPEKIKGIMTTGLSTPPGSQNFVHPSKLRDELNRVTNGYECDIPVDFGRMVRENRKEAHEKILRFAIKMEKITLHLAKKYEWDVLAVIFTSTDRLQHFYWNDYDLIKSHYKMLDATIGKLLEIEPKANVVCVSDHGFGPLTKCFYINNWLSHSGFLKVRKSIINSLIYRSGLTYRRVARAVSRLKLYHITAKFTPYTIKKRLPTSYLDKDALLDSERSLAYMVDVNGGIFVNRELGSDQKNEELKHVISKGLQQVEDNGVRPVSNTFYNNEILWGPHAHRGPDIFVVPREGYETSPHSYPFGILGLPITTATGTHRPEGIFIAHGPDIKRGYKLRYNINTWDIAPTILHMLGLPIPDYMDGVVLREILEEDDISRMEPAKLRKRGERESERTGEEVYTQNEKEELKKRLRTLGYL